MADGLLAICNFTCNKLCSKISYNIDTQVCIYKLVDLLAWEPDESAKNQRFRPLLDLFGPISTVYLTWCRLELMTDRGASPSKLEKSDRIFIRPFQTQCLHWFSRGYFLRLKGIICNIFLNKLCIKSYDIVPLNHHCDSLEVSADILPSACTFLPFFSFSPFTNPKRLYLMY